MGFSKGTLLKEAALYLARLQLLITLNDNLANLHLLLFVDDDIKDDMVFLSHIGALLNIDISILKALIVEILLSKNLGTIYHIGMNLRTSKQSQFLLHIFALTLLQADIVDGRHTRMCLKLDVQIYFIAYDRVCRDLHKRE